jgi:hypothetical protein
MKTVSDYIKLVESEGAVNTVSSGAIAGKDVPLGKVQKRKVQESDAYEGENPLADAAGDIPLLTVYAPESPTTQCDPHRFHQKQQYNNDSMSS